MACLKHFVWLCCLLATTVLSLSSGSLIRRSTLGASPNLHRRTANDTSIDDVDPLTLLYPEHNLSVPIDHFPADTKYTPHSNDSFNLRYWFDASYYQPGGPVIVLQSGETSGVGRLPFLQKGIIHVLAKATNGIGVILEHRYYGTSFPTPDLSTENLRFLTTEQAVRDMVFFAENVVFEGFEGVDLTARGSAWVAYGGSYAGALVAFLRKGYPEVYWGAISSSGVTEAIWDFWRYYEPVREYGPPDCIDKHTKLINVVDNILINNTAYTAQLKHVFGLQDVVYDDDFAQVLSLPIGGWQGRNWDPELNDPSFYDYCSNITANITLTPPNTTTIDTVHTLLAAADYSPCSSHLTVPMLNFISYIQTTYIRPYPSETLTTRYNTHNRSLYTNTSLSASEDRSWPYQYCTQWGFLQTGSGVPRDRLPLVSRQLTLEYNSIICRESFNITSPPDTDAINKYGGYDIEFPRLAIVDGEEDPWREASPHAEGRSNRTSTTQEPFLLIKGAVHHWDENGVFGNESVVVPGPVEEVQREEVRFVKEWVKEFKEQKATGTGGGRQGRGKCIKRVGV
ncbi:MAG: hypothetical protein Q9183_001792 [Haloplaca sp. 2 TL-2023]